MKRTLLRAAIFVPILLLPLFISVTPLFAQGDLGNGNGGGLTNPLGTTSDLQTLLGKVLDAVIAIGTVVVTIMLVYCGFLFVVARGNEEKIREARSALLWTVIGALVLLGAKAIQGIITTTTQSLGG
jgi:heme/copper-type cytochrome/quinol oxidase subunit 2